MTFREGASYATSYATSLILAGWMWVMNVNWRNDHNSLVETIKSDNAWHEYEETRIKELNDRISRLDSVRNIAALQDWATDVDDDLDELFYDTGHYSLPPLPVRHSLLPPPLPGPRERH